jgi:TatD DNase family protein
MSGLVDTHTHLGSRQFAGDLPAVLARAREAGVGAMVVPAVDLANAREVLAICEREPDVFAAVGIHPCDVDSVTGEAWVEELRELARHPRVVALGETGLDHFHAPPEGFTVEVWRAWQKRVLRLHLELAVELALPVVLHNRDSWDDLVAEVAPFHGRVRAQFHCFTGTLEQAMPLVEAGHVVSFTGIVTFKNPGSMAEVAASVPAGSYLLETDAPYLAPMPHRGKRCEPAYVRFTAEKVAALRGETLEQVAAETGATAREFFLGGFAAGDGRWEMEDRETGKLKCG